MSTKTTIATDETFQALTSKGTSVVKFTASWCGPCRMMDPIVDSVIDEARATGLDTKFIEVDVDECPKTASEFGVRGVPTFVLIDDGEESHRRVGMLKRHELLAIAAGADFRPA
jgi:thioredoxin 1